MERVETQPADYADVLRVSGRDGLPLVVLGGQAVNLWAERSLAAEPCLAEFRPFTSKDLDIFGNEADLDHLASRTGLSKHPAQRKIFIPSAGYLDLPLRDGTSAKVEVLKRLYRVTTEEIAQSALLLEHGDLRVRVLHPLMLLRAKLANAVDLPQAKRQDVRHLRMMLHCVRAYLRDKVTEVTAGMLTGRECIELLEEFLDLASTHAAATAARRYGIQWIDALPVKEVLASENPRLRNFATKRLPQWQARTRR